MSVPDWKGLIKGAAGEGIFLGKSQDAKTSEVRKRKFVTNVCPTRLSQQTEVTGAVFFGCEELPSGVRRRDGSWRIGLPHSIFEDPP